jgi:hypothetical protein
VKVDSAWRVRYRPKADSWAECSVDEARSVAFERCLQVRERRAFQGSTDKRGWYYFATTSEMKWCESRFEMRVLRCLDHDGAVAGVSVKPLVLHYRDEAGRASHTPDIFVRGVDGSGTVVDVHAGWTAEKAEFVRQAAATKVACQAAGWSYEICSTIDPVFEANLDWLAACRHQLIDPLGCAGSLLEACSKPQRLGAVVAAFPPPALSRPVIAYLLWAGQLVTDLAIPLTDASILSVPLVAHGPS